MLYTEDTRIEALAVHVVGNKSKDEPLTVSPELSAQVADEGLMRTLTAYFLGGFKSEECYNLHHETDLGCNEVWNFACRIFDDPEALLEHSVSLAKHLYESGMSEIAVLATEEPQQGAFSRVSAGSSNSPTAPITARGSS